MTQPAADAPRVLVIDDEPAMLATIAALLDTEFAVTVAADLGPASAALAGAEYDVVVSDYNLPGGSGIAFLREVCTRSPNVMGILVTGYADHPDVRAARANWREFKVLIKPYNPLELISIVKTAARLARLRKATQRLATQIQKA